MGDLHRHFRYLDIYHNRCVCVLTITLKIQHTMLQFMIMGTLKTQKQIESCKVCIFQVLIPQVEIIYSCKVKAWVR